MYDLGLLGISLEIAGDTVIKPHAHSNKQVTLVGLHIGAKIAVHTQHTFV